VSRISEFPYGFFVDVLSSSMAENLFTGVISGCRDVLAAFQRTVIDSRCIAIWYSCVNLLLNGRLLIFQNFSTGNMQDFNVELRVEIGYIRFGNSTNCITVVFN
jgi:hypothetical protein